MLDTSKIGLTIENVHIFLPLKWSIQDEVLCWTLPKLVIKHWSLSSKLNYRIIHHRISSRTKILCCTLLFTAKMFRSIYGQYILSGIYGQFILSGIYGRFILSGIYGRYILSHGSPTAQPLKMYWPIYEESQSGTFFWFFTYYERMHYLPTKLQLLILVSWPLFPSTYVGTKWYHTYLLSNKIR